MFYMPSDDCENISQNAKIPESLSEFWDEVLIQTQTLQMESQI